MSLVFYFFTQLLSVSVFYDIYYLIIIFLFSCFLSSNSIMNTLISHCYGFPKNIIYQYKIIDLVDKDGFVHVNIRKCMYGLNQVSRIDFDCLVKLLKPHVYYPLCPNRGIGCHKNIPTEFTLCIDNFWINYKNNSHDHHLFNPL